jgi:23S rRNA (uracil1939-C5)-methyltransferase
MDYKFMLAKGKQVELTIESLAPGGEGVSKDFGIPVFINKTAPGDRLLVEIYDNRRSFAKGALLKVIEPGKERVEPLCKLFKVCGGCQWMHINYAGQLVYKKGIIEQALRHIGGEEISNACAAVIQPTIPSKLQFGYRNKVNLPVANPQQSKRLLAGYYETNSHKLVNIKHCPIQPTLLDTVLEQIKLLGEKYIISAYDEINDKGLLRHIQMRFSEANQNVLVTLVVNTVPNKLPDRLKKLADELMNQNRSIVGVCVNCNPQKGNRILGEETICLAGQSFIEEISRTEKTEYPDILKQGLKFQLSSITFFQINTDQTVTLLEIVTEEIKQYLKEKPREKITLIDAYAGVGSIAFWLAPFVDKVLAIEDNAAAVKDGEHNLKLNQINNVHFYQGKVEEVLPSLLTEKQDVSIVVLDPPRQGLNPVVIESMTALSPDLIIYISCNPATLARDLRLILATNGYRVEKIVPIDLFPQTYHVESVTVLRKIM